MDNKIVIINSLPKLVQKNRKNESTKWWNQLSRLVNKLYLTFIGNLHLHIGETKLSASKIYKEIFYLEEI